MGSVKYQNKMTTYCYNLLIRHNIYQNPSILQTFYKAVAFGVCVWFFFWGGGYLSLTFASDKKLYFLNS